MGTSLAKLVEGFTDAQVDLATLGARAITGALATATTPAGSATLATVPGMPSTTYTTMGGTLPLVAAYVTMSQALDGATDSEWTEADDKHHCPMCPPLTRCEECGKDAGEGAGERDDGRGGQHGHQRRFGGDQR